ncbi:MAG: UDP-4-amino-4,6-dideoxy-N-acetyl-beta-L-altrosamine transaminase [Cyclobacteriaceae bacterium]|nr:UDP-4-amino-4,6-dideoxy-N-acetyl-beta-L-altrosamine transaminase [Cyclobacteriaceae bacterium HetDA_MAG_MS6]
MKAIPYGRQHVTDKDIAAVVEVLKSDFLTQGPKVQEFEEAFARYVGCQHAIAVSNGTAALHLSAIALGVRSNTKVLTTPISFAATANCIQYCGGQVDFIDIDPASMTIDIDALEQKLATTPKNTYSGVIPIDFAGLPVDMARIKTIADKYGLWILEDSCHAPGGYFSDQTGTKYFCGSGSFADLAIFSFHPVKHIATGEGGMITTNSKELSDKLKMLRTHGITKDPKHMAGNDGGWYYEMHQLGYNYRLTDIQAALGISQLTRADENLKKRKLIAERYDDSFKGLPIKKQKSSEGHAYHLYVIEVERRKELYDAMKRQNIFCQVHYIPIHTLPFYQSHGWKKGDFPVSEEYYKKCLSLPMYPTLQRDEQDYVIQCVKEHFDA